MRGYFIRDVEEGSLKMRCLGEVWMTEGVGDVTTRQESIPGRGNSRVKSPEARTSLPYMGNISKARSIVSEWGVEQLRSMGQVEASVEVTWQRDPVYFGCLCC